MNAFEKNILDKTKNGKGLTLDEVEELEKSDLDITMLTVYVEFC